MLHEAIFFATCNATNVALQVARTLYFSQRCETSSLRVTSPLQLATQFCQNGPIRAHLSQDVGDLAHPSSCLLLYALEFAKKVANVWHPLFNLKGFLCVIVALQVARKIASCYICMALRPRFTTSSWYQIRSANYRREKCVAENWWWEASSYRLFFTLSNIW